MFQRLLRATGDYLGTNLTTLARGASWITVGNIVTKASSLILAYLFARFVSLEIYGTYKYVVSVATTLLIFTLTGINTSVIRSVILGFEGTVRAAYRTRLRWSALGSVAALGIGVYYLLQSQTLLGYAFFITAALFPFFDTPTLYASFLNGKKMFREDALADIVVTGAYVLAMSITLLLTENLLVLVGVYFAVHVLARNMVYRYVFARVESNAKVDPSWFSYGAHLSFMDVLVTFANYIDRIILFNLTGPVSLAVYSFASAIPEQLKIFHSFIPIMGFPAWTSSSSEELQKTLSRKMLVFFVESVLLVLAYIAAAPAIFNILFPRYLDAVPFSQVYMLSFLNFAPSFILPALQARSKTKELYLFNVVTSIGQITLLLVGGIYYGLWGVVIARVAGRIFMTLVALLFYKRL